MISVQKFSGDLEIEIDGDILVFTIDYERYYIVIPETTTDTSYEIEKGFNLDFNGVRYSEEGNEKRLSNSELSLFYSRVEYYARFNAD